MRSLSAANLANIAGSFHDPVIIVRIPTLSKQWSTKAKASHETRILAISPIRQEVNPLGGLAQFGDFFVSIQGETPTQFIQDREPDNETLEVVIQYGSDAEIVLANGRVDRWEYAKGILTLHCIANIDLLGKTLPTQRITESAFSSFDVPGDRIGKMVPLTIGQHNRARGWLIDGTDDAFKIKYNRTITDFPGIDAVTDVLFRVGEEYATLWSTLTRSDNGHVAMARLGATAAIGTVEATLKTTPIAARADNADPDIGGAGLTNEANAIDGDLGTAATFEADPGVGNDATMHLRLRLRDLPDLGHKAQTLANYVLIKAALFDSSGNPDTIVTANGDECLADIEDTEDTWDGTGSDTVIGNGDGAVDNLVDLDDSETAIGVAGSGLTTPRAHSDKDLTLRFTEHGDAASPRILYVWQMLLRMDMQVDPALQSWLGDIAGYSDDNGTYTASAGDVIENPADVLHFLLANASLLALSGFDTSSFTTARTDLSSYILAGQVLETTAAAEVLDRIAREGKLKLFLDFNDDWKVAALTVPVSEDKELIQADGDFVTDDGLEGEILSVTQSPLDELYNQFEIRYAWNPDTNTYEKTLELDETTEGPIGDWLTESQSRYNVTRKLSVDLDWVRDDKVAISYGNYLVHLLADRKRIAEFQTAFNGLELEIGDKVRLTHVDMEKIEDTTVYAGYRAGSPLATIKAGYTDPDTSAVIKAGAKVEHHEGRHVYEITAVEDHPLDGVRRFTGRQRDVSRSPLSEPW